MPDSLTYFAITSRGPHLVNWCEERDAFLCLETGQAVRDYVVSPPLSSCSIVWHTEPHEKVPYVTHVGIMEGGEYELLYTAGSQWHSQWTGEVVTPLRFVSSFELLTEEVDF